MNVGGNRVFPAVLTAIGVGAGFGNPLFSLPALTSLRYRALELEWLLLPTAAAVMIAVACVGAQWIPGRGYPFAAAGGIAGTFAIILSDQQVGGPVAWVLAVAAAGGLALGGLALAAGLAGGPERVAIGAGLAAGIGASNPIWDLIREQTWPAFLIHLTVFVTAVLAASLAWHDPRPTRGSGPAAVVVLAGVIVMAGLVARSAVMEELGLDATAVVGVGTEAGWAGTWSALGVGVAAALVLVWYGYRLGGADLARWPVLGFALAGPVTILASGYDYGPSSVGALAVLGAVVAALAGAFLALLLDRAAPWEVLGVFVAVGGLALGSVSVRLGPVAYLLVLGGAVFALSTGLVRTAGLPAGGAGLGLGLAGMLLSAQALGPVTLELLSSSGFGQAQLVTPAASAAAALVIIGLFALRRPSLSRELLTQVA